MKFYQVTFLAASALLSTVSGTVDSEKREQILDHYAGSTTPIGGCDPVLDEDSPEIRYKKVPVVGGGFVYVLEEVGERRRHLKIKKNAGEMLPWPVDGATIEKSDIVIKFREDTAVSDVQCFIFTHVDPNLSFNVCDSPKITYGDGIAELQAAGFPVGEWSWHVRSAAGAESTPQTFTIEKHEKGGATMSVSEVVGEAEWGFGGQVQGATGRIFFSSYGIDYACTGTVVHDKESGRSVVLTAAHCVFDDIDWNFGSNVIFIPNRDENQMGENVTGDDIHRQCSWDICGCWTASAGVVLDKWTDTPWPDRLAYDYGFWIIDDVGAHEGKDCGGDVLDEAVNAMTFEPPGDDLTGSFAHALGYSLEFEPDFRYCANTLSIKQPTYGVDTYWLEDCGLTTGASGGPWVKEMGTDGSGTIVSVGSWSYTEKPGYGGPIIDRKLAHCLMDEARKADFRSIEAENDGFEGIHVNCDETEAPTGEDESDTTTRTTTTTSGTKTATSYGDPHMKTWSGEKFDFHGACDLLLFRNPEYANGLGITIHIRTKISTFWSFIEAAVIRIGDDTLEIMGRSGDAGQHWLNGKLGEEPKEDGLLEFKLGGHDVHLKKINAMSNRFRIELANGDAISMDTFKKFVSVNIRAETPEKFSSASGLMGSYPDGEWMGRDGKTLFKDPIEFGKEWQVLSAEPMLFHNIDGVQHPQVCTMPDNKTRLGRKQRRLGASMITEDDAALACARVRPEVRDECIFDVLATNDKDMAGSY